MESGQDSREVIAHLNRELLALKPLKTVREHFVHHYRKLSNLIRRVQAPNNPRNAVASSRYSRRPNSEQPPADHRDADEQFTSFFGGLLNKAEELAVLEEMIVESYLRAGEWECAGVWGEREAAVDPAGLFRESSTLREGICRGDFTEAIRWCENERLYETHHCFLEYDLKLMHLLGLMRNGSSEQAVTYYMASFAKFLEDKKEEMEKLCLYVFFKANKFWDEETSSDSNFR